MDRAAEMLRHARPDRPRGRPPGRLPPARAVREGLPAPPRPVAVGLPDAPPRRSRAPSRSPKRPSTARPERGVPPRPARDRATGAVRARRAALLPVRMDDRIPRDGARRIAAVATAATWVRWSSSASIASALGIAARAGHRLVPGGRLDPGRQDRHPLGRPDHRLGAGVRPRDGGRPLLGHRLPHAARRGAPRRAADPRQHAPRGHLDRDPRARDRRRSAPTPTSSLLDIEKAPAKGDQRVINVYGRAVRLDVRLQRAGQEGHVAPALPAGAVRGEVPDPLARTSSTTSGSPQWRMKIDAVPGHHDRLPRDPSSSARYHASSAPSSAASGTPSCARPRTSSRPTVRRLGRRR